MIEYIDLKTARTYAKMTARQAASHLHKSQCWLTAIENGTRGISAYDLQKLMSIYGLDDTPLNKINLANIKEKFQNKKMRKIKKTQMLSSDFS